jgi:hypothetical protein
MPDRPIPKPKQFLKVLDILNTQGAANMIDPKSYADMVGQYAFKAYKNDELSYRDYLGIVKPLFGKAGEMVTKKIEERDKDLERYATGGRVKYSDGSDEPDISKLKEKIIELMDTDNLTFEEAYREAREEGYAAGGRVSFGEGSGERTDLGDVNLTRIQNAKATGSSISNASKFKALPGYDNITYSDYQNKETGDINRKYNVRIRLTEDGKTKVLTKDNKFQNIDSLDDAIKIRDDFRKTTPKNIKVRNPNADALDKAKRVEAIIKNKGLPYSYSGTKKFPKGHAGNIYGKNIITPSEIIYTPQKINLTMSGKKGMGVNRDNPMQALDFRIKDTEQKIEDIKKSNMSAAKKKTELAKLDNKLVNYVAKSGGFKVATLSDDSKYGKSFKSLQSLDMFDEFEGMSEKEMNNFIKKYKNMKVNKNTTKKDFDNILKAKIASENIKFAKQNAVRGGGAPVRIDPGSSKPGGLSPFRKLKYLSKGGPVYGKYAKQIISS